MGAFLGPDRDIWDISLMEYGSILEDGLRNELKSSITLGTGVIIAAMGPITAIANAVVIAVIWKDRFKQLRRSPSNTIIASMATCDFLVGIGCSGQQAFLFIGLSAGATMPSYYTITSTIVAAFLMGISMLHILALTIDRVVAVSNPLLYKSRVTRKRVLVTVVAIWIFFLIVQLLQIPAFKTGTIPTAMIVVIIGFAEVIVFMLCIYIIIHVRHQTKEMKIQAAPRKNKRLYMEREKKTTKAILIILVLFLICFPPYLITFITTVACFSCKNHLDLILTLLCLAIILGNFNSCLNPFLYAFRLPKFRKPVALLIERFIPCKTSSNSECNDTTINNNSHVNLENVSTTHETLNDKTKP